MNNREDRYFLVPHDDESNARLGRGKFDGESHLGLLCSDGMERPGFEVTLAVVQHAFRSRKKGSQVEFTAFRQVPDEQPKVLSANEALGHKPSGQSAPEVAQMAAGLRKVLARQTART